MAAARRRPAASVQAAKQASRQEKSVQAHVDSGLHLLLDTHTFLWFVSGSDRLSARARRAIETPTNQVYVSAASVWEIAIKRHLGKLPDAMRFEPTLASYLKRHGFTELVMTADHAEAAGALPPLHRDPFDRMLIAQARVDTLRLVSNESLFDAYKIRRLW
jgi:PIN domain nuclease of toxin-antitoxin system